MNLRQGSGDETASLGALLRVHELCGRFEAEWRQSRPPRIEDYVKEAAESERSFLLQELLHVDVEYRRRTGSIPARDEYLRRFPEHGRLVDLALGAAPEAASAEEPLPERIGRYRVLGRIGEGGQGQVFRVVHPALEKEMVLKLSRAAPAGGGLDVNRLAAEGRILAGLEHPHLARVHDVDVWEGRPFLVLEYVRGRNLAQYAADRPLPPRRAAALLAQVARALEVAHARGLVHRDIKPENIVVDEDGEPRLIDFGLALVRDAWGAESADRGWICGTLWFMAPEQARGEAERVGARTDVFALGAVLYFLLVGQAPYQGGDDNPDVKAVLARARACDFDRDELGRRGAPPRLAAICLKAMEAEPEARQESAARLADELEAFARGPVFRRRALTAAAVLVAAALILWAALPRGTVMPDPGGAVVLAPPALEVWRGGVPLRLADALPLRTGDELEVRCEVPAGLEAALFWLDAGGGLHELSPCETVEEEGKRAVRYPAGDKVAPLEAPVGTELVLVCAARGAAPRRADVEAALGALRAPLPPLGREVLLRLDHDEVRTSGHRGPGEPRGLEAKAAVAMAREIQGRLKERFGWVAGVAFPHED